MFMHVELLIKLHIDVQEFNIQPLTIACFAGTINANPRVCLLHLKIINSGSKATLN